MTFGHVPLFVNSWFEVITVSLSPARVKFVMGQLPVWFVVAETTASGLYPSRATLWSIATSFPILTLLRDAVNVFVVYWDTECYALMKSTSIVKLHVTLVPPVCRLVHVAKAVSPSMP